MEHRSNIEISALRFAPFESVAISIQRGCLTVLEGPCASGKTRLLRDLLWAQSTHRLKALRGFAIDPEQALPADSTAAPIAGLARTSYYSAFAAMRRSSQSLLSYLAGGRATNQPLCQRCGQSFVPMSLLQQADQILSQHAGATLTFAVEFCLPHGDQLSGTIMEWQKRGFTRAVTDDGIVDLDMVESPPLRIHIDTLACAAAERSRLTEALRIASGMSASALCIFTLDAAGTLQQIPWQVPVQCLHCGFVPPPLSTETLPIGMLIEQECTRSLAAPIGNLLYPFLSDLGLCDLPTTTGIQALSSSQWIALQFAHALLHLSTDAVLALDRPSAGLPRPSAERMAEILTTFSAHGGTAIVADDSQAFALPGVVRLRLSPGFGACRSCSVEQAPPLRKDPLTAPFAGERIDSRWAMEHQGQIVQGRCDEAQLPAIKQAITQLLTVEAAALPPPLQGRLPRLVELNAPAPAQGPYSIAASVMEILEPLREWYALLPAAKAGGLGPASFSFTPRKKGESGACLSCRGSGFEADGQQCSSCGGLRYRPEIQRIAYRGLSIAEALQLNVHDALNHFREVPRAALPLRVLEALSVGYLRLGALSADLSAGERCRSILAASLGAMHPPRVLLLNDFFMECSMEDRSRTLDALRPFLSHGVALVLER